jgi:ABC-type transport system involved in cytochrome c biogenesis permease subunit
MVHESAPPPPRACARLRPAVLTRALCVAAVLAAQALAQGAGDRSRLDLAEIRRLPVLANTRFKPLESYAREVVLAVTGQVEPKRLEDGSAPRRGAAGPRKRGDPLLTYLEWWLAPDEARTVPWILIDRPGARKLLGFPSEQRDFDHVSLDELAANPRFDETIDALLEKPRQALTPDEAEVLEVARRAAVFSRAALLREPERLPRQLQFGPPIVPTREPLERGVLYEWQPAPALGSGFPGFDYAQAETAAVEEGLARLGRAFQGGDAAAFTAASTGLRSAIAALGSPEYPDLATMDREVRYHRSRFFDRAAWLYLASFILAIFSAIWRNRLVLAAAVLPGLAALAMNVYGIAERTALSGRAMLGNLYETLLYVAGVSFVLAIVSEAIFRSRWFLITGSLLSMAFLRIAEDRALLLNPSITVLQPVLDRNFWIHIHVPVIVASYAPLLLAALMGNLYLLTSVFRPTARTALAEVGRIQYWAMIPGVILLFAGLVLGGIWADASWGRFWGWDPKETWGFITWLVFVVLIHGRWSGWLKDYGTAVGTIVGGASLIMTYWGVNFLLPGLHSYAAANDASAGLPLWAKIPAWVVGYAGFEAALVAAAAFFRKRAPVAAVPTVEVPEPEAAVPVAAPAAHR